MTFHLYGLILGCAVIIGAYLAERYAQKYGLQQRQFEQLQRVALVCGFLSARAWHVITDFQLYQNHLWKVLAVWQGGLSIIGGLIGASLGLCIYAYLKQLQRKQLLLFFDSIVFGLPVAQALGRLGNYVNQELYGSPTQLPWKLFIESAHRLPGYESVAYYHPLFAYESVAVGIFAVAVIYLEKAKKLPALGRGVLAVTYVSYYSVVRFMLDFLRIDTAVHLYGFGVNQWVCLVVFCTTVATLLRIYKSSV